MKEINNAEVDNAKDTDVVMAMYNLAEFSDIYSKKCRNVWQYYRDEPALYSNNNITDFPANTNNSISNRISFKYEKKKINNWENRKRWYKRCWNNGTIKISK